MISVQMTKNILDRPPKVFGLFTVKQLVGVIIAAAIFGVLLLLLPFKFGIRIIVAALPTIPVLIIAFFPPDQVSPLVYIRYFIKVLIQGSTKVEHDGNTVYYKPKENQKVKIKRYRDYKGFR